MLILWERQNTRTILEPEMEKMYQSIEVAEVLTTEHRDEAARTTAERRTRLMLAFLAWEMQLGRFTHVQERVDSILKCTAVHESTRHRAVAHILSMFVSSAEKGVGSWSNESLWKAAQLHASMIPSCQFLAGRNSDVGLGLLMLLYVASGHLDDFGAQVDREVQGSEGQYAQWARKLVGEPVAGNLDRRTELMFGYLQCLQAKGQLVQALTEFERFRGPGMVQSMGCGIRRYHSRGIVITERASLFDSFAGAGVMAPDEMEEVATRLAARIEPPDAVWGAMAQTQHQSGSRDAARASLDKAIELLPADPADDSVRSRRQRWLQLRDTWNGMRR